jgi:hypothetical protein
MFFGILLEGCFRIGSSMNSNRALMIGSRAIMPLLIVQFLIGMFAELFVTPPTGTGNAIALIFRTGSIALILHVVIAVFLIVLSVALLLFSALTRRRISLVLSVLGLAFMALAFFAGVAFVLGGYSNDGLSYAMAVGFIVSFVVYGALAGQGVRTPVKPDKDHQAASTLTTH